MRTQPQPEIGYLAERQKERNKERVSSTRDNEDTIDNESLVSTFSILKRQSERKKERISERKNL